jgi:hypothetical protein
MRPSARDDHAAGRSGNSPKLSANLAAWGIIGVDVDVGHAGTDRGNQLIQLSRGKLLGGHRGRENAYRVDYAGERAIA